MLGYKDGLSGGFGQNVFDGLIDHFSSDRVAQFPSFALECFRLLDCPSKQCFSVFHKLKLFFDVRALRPSWRGRGEFLGSPEASREDCQGGDSEGLRGKGCPSEYYLDNRTGAVKWCPAKERFRVNSPQGAKENREAIAPNPISVLRCLQSLSEHRNVNDRWEERSFQRFFFAIEATEAGRESVNSLEFPMDLFPVDSLGKTTDRKNDDKRIKR